MNGNAEDASVFVLREHRFFSLLIFCDFVVSYKVTVICVSVLLAKWM